MRVALRVLLLAAIAGCSSTNDPRGTAGTTATLALGGASGAAGHMGSGAGMDGTGALGGGGGTGGTGAGTSVGAGGGASGGAAGSPVIRRNSFNVTLKESEWSLTDLTYVPPLPASSFPARVDIVARESGEQIGIISPVLGQAFQASVTLHPGVDTACTSHPQHCDGAMVLTVPPESSLPSPWAPSLLAISLDSQGNPFGTIAGVASFDDNSTCVVKPVLAFTGNSIQDDTPPQVVIGAEGNRLPWDELTIAVSEPVDTATLTAAPMVQDAGQNPVPVVWQPTDELVVSGTPLHVSNHIVTRPASWNSLPPGDTVLRVPAGLTDPSGNTSVETMATLHVLALPPAASTFGLESDDGSLLLLDPRVKYVAATSRGAERCEQGGCLQLDDLYPGYARGGAGRLSGTSIHGVRLHARMVSSVPGNPLYTEFVLILRAIAVDSSVAVSKELLLSTLMTPESTDDHTPWFDLETTLPTSTTLVGFSFEIAPPVGQKSPGHCSNNPMSSMLVVEQITAIPSTP